jgi:hypothetical protein
VAGEDIMPMQATAYSSPGLHLSWSITGVHGAPAPTLTPSQSSDMLQHWQHLLKEGSQHNRALKHSAWRTDACLDPQWTEHQQWCHS